MVRRLPSILMCPCLQATTACWSTTFVEGLTPSSVTVGLRYSIHDKGSPLAFGYAGDGSEMIWSNAIKDNQRVGIESIEFYNQLIGAGYHDDEDAKPPTVKASIDAASAAIVGKLADLEKAFVKGSSLIMTVIIVACAVLYFARH